MTDNIKSLVQDGGMVSSWGETKFPTTEVVKTVADARAVILRLMFNEPDDEDIKEVGPMPEDPNSPT
ncbi:hypothetical protein [Paraburkholderia terrae]|uniref:SLH domain-containing protein n=1 Tax=Paraburkholderia terrae TaxID=311230 RepID=A0ABN6JZZ1_9BURK|nr:hypothetical protein [Paraburkholderia terrae]BCZ85317.1 hypothetical protein PTKU64_89920 [Paraburkholderia terrae]BDC45620.1 hypothetical protein PTKU15_89170 [Paraburkholderia terrae]